MTTGRRPTFPPDLADTLDEHGGGMTPAMQDELDHHPSIHVTPTDIANSEWGRALRADVDALKATRATDALRAAAADRWMTWGGRAASVIAASAVAFLTYMFALARSNGDASATTREREAQRIDIYSIVRRLDRDSGVTGSRLDALERTVGRYPLGFVPMRAPQPPAQDPSP